MQAAKMEIVAMPSASRVFAEFARLVSLGSGKPLAFIAALAAVVVWAACGPLFDYSETWQLVINTGTTIVTFLMVFVLQNAQMRDTRAVQAKLDELILTSKAENRFVGIENLCDEDFEEIGRLVARASARKHPPKAKAKKRSAPKGKAKVAA